MAPPSGPDRDKDARPFERNAAGEWIIPDGDENHHHCRVGFPDGNGGYRMCSHKHYFSNRRTLYEHMKYCDKVKVASRRPPKPEAAAPRGRVSRTAIRNEAPPPPNRSQPQVDFATIEDEHQQPRDSTYTAQPAPRLGLYTPMQPSEAVPRDFENPYSRNAQPLNAQPPPPNDFMSQQHNATSYMHAMPQSQQPNFGTGQAFGYPSPYSQPNFGPMYNPPSMTQQQYRMAPGQHDNFASQTSFGMHRHGEDSQHNQPQHSAYSNHPAARPGLYPPMQPNEAVRYDFENQHSRNAQPFNVPPPPPPPNNFMLGQHHAASYMNVMPPSQQPNFGLGQGFDYPSPYLQPNFGPQYDPSPHDEPAFVDHPQPQQRPQPERVPDNLVNQRREENAAARARAIAPHIKREIEDDDELMEIDEETFERR